MYVSLVNIKDLFSCLFLHTISAKLQIETVLANHVHANHIAINTNRATIYIFQAHEIYESTSPKAIHACNYKADPNKLFPFVSSLRR